MRQRGAAILTALLVVALVATLASSMMWQQWRGIEAETAQRTRAQAAWILTGALDWARLILREDARHGGADYLSEPWAVPLAPARLSTFLAAEDGQALVDDEGDPSQQAFLSGVIEDQQGRLNVANLLDNDQLDAAGLAAWTRLFQQLNLPEAELQAMTQALLLAQHPAAATSGQQVPLWPGSVGELAWLGLSAPTLQALRPFVTLLPQRTTVNLNTAPAEVLVAAVPGMDMAQAQALVQARSTRHMETLTDAEQLVNNAAVRFDAKLHGVSSRYFSVTGQLKMGTAVMQERSLLQRDGMVVKAIARRREVLSADLAHLQ